MAGARTNTPSVGVGKPLKLMSPTPLSPDSPLPRVDSTSPGADKLKMMMIEIENQTLKSQNKELLNKLSQFQNAYLALQAMTKELQRQNTAFQSQQNAYISQIRVLLGRIKELQEQSKESQAQQKMNMDQIKAFQETIKALQEQIKTLETLKDDLQSTITSLSNALLSQIVTNTELTSLIISQANPQTSFVEGVATQGAGAGSAVSTKPNRVDPSNHGTKRKLAEISGAGAGAETGTTPSLNSIFSGNVRSISLTSGLNPNLNNPLVSSLKPGTIPPNQEPPSLKRQKLA